MISLGRGRAGPVSIYSIFNQRAKLIRHHAKGLRQLGAEESEIEQLIARLAEPQACTPQAAQVEAAAPETIRRSASAKVCLGAFGIPGGQTRKQEYSVLKDRSTGGLHRARSNNRDTTTNKKQKREQRPAFAREYFRGKDLSSGYRTNTPQSA